MSHPTYAPGSSVESCPAATGELDLIIDIRCNVYRDGAHRCRQARLPHRPHHCLCGVRWVCLPPNYAARRPDAAPAGHEPRHAA